MSKQDYRDIHGILLFDKPQGLSSNQALQRVRRLYNARKAGHTGSLDPLATGLLPVCFGEATKIAGYLLGSRKAYEAELRLGATTTACQHIIPAVLREFKESFPEHAIAIEPGDTPQLVTSLLHHRIDLALALEAEKETQLEVHPLFDDELQFVVGALHPWAKAGRVDRPEIPRQHYILYSKRSITFRLIEKYFKDEDVSLNTVIELGSMEAIKELVKLGLGIGIMAPWTARKEIEDGSMVALPLGRRKLVRRWGILYWRGRHLNLAEETFVGLCESATVPLQVGRVADAA